nr:hypothetical protein [Halovivax sp. KZCA124]
MSDSSSEPANNSTDSGLASGESDVFTDVVMEDDELEIEIADDASVEFINLVDPNGELYDQQRLQAEETRITFDILGRYDDAFPAGEYTLVARNGDEEVDTTTITLEADCKITDVLWAKENPDMDWDRDSPVWDEYAAIVIENEGTIPSLLTELEWTGAPAAKLGPDDSISYYHETRLPPGKTTVYSFSQIYQTSGASGSLDCREYGTEPMTVTAVVQVGPNPSYTQQIEYGGGQPCELTIVEGNSDESASNGGER